MTIKPKQQLLSRLLQTLVDEWGYGTVLASLQKLESSPHSDERTHGKERLKGELSATQLAADMPVADEKKHLILRLAHHFDEGSSFPNISDIRAFLLSHHHNARSIRDRSNAFKRMLPILSGMSEKGLERLISKSRHSGPAELEAISNAIREAGEDLRGFRQNVRGQRNKDDTDTNNNS